MSLLLLFRPSRKIPEPERTYGGSGSIATSWDEKPRRIIDIERSDQEFMQLLAVIMPILGD